MHKATSGAYRHGDTLAEKQRLDVASVLYSKVRSPDSHSLSLMTNSYCPTHHEGCFIIGALFTTQV